MKYLMLIKTWGLDKRFAVVFPALAAIGVAVLEVVSVLPEGNAKTATIAAIMAANGFIIQLRVWSKAAASALGA